MRKLTIYNYSKEPEQALGQVRLEDGVISFSGFSAYTLAELQRGIPNRQTGERVMPAEGEAFFDLVLLRYSGAYCRAVES